MFAPGTLALGRLQIVNIGPKQFPNCLPIMIRQQLSRNSINVLWRDIV
jgi:hypothetical protein